jgi:probable addiction module antidote protein
MEPSKFEISDYLDSNEMIAEYLNEVLENGNETDLVKAIGHVAKAIGMTKIAEKSGMSRPSLYKALSDGAKPQFATIMKVLRAIGGQITVNPLPAT